MPQKTPKAIELAESAAPIREKLLEVELDQARTLLNETQYQFHEALSNLDLMIDNAGWVEVGEYGNYGPELYQIQNISEQLRNLAALNAHMKRALTLRQSYIWEGDIKHDNIPENTDGRSRVANVRAIIDDPINQRNFFSAEARKRQEACLYTNGHYFVVGTEAEGATPKRLNSVPIWEISGLYCNPDDPSEVWAYRRKWTSFPQGETGGVDRAEWIFVDGFIDRRVNIITYAGTLEPVAQNKRMFVERVNDQDGWTWGLPDAAAAMQWAKKYRDGVLGGLDMQAALSRLAFKLSGKSSAGVKGAAAKVASAGEKGATAAMVDGMDITALSSAGRGYDFDSLRPVLAIVATALEVSVVALSSDPGAAGSSYGSAATLDAPTRLAMGSRRLLHEGFERQILSWLGAPDARVWFDSLDEGTELYRSVQAVLLKWTSGLYSPEEIKTELEAIFGHEIVGDVPDGVLIPNNKDSLARRDIDTDIATTTPAPTQGVANGTGGDGGSSGNDTRTDQIS